MEPIKSDGCLFIRQPADTSTLNGIANDDGQGHGSTDKRREDQHWMGVLHLVYYVLVLVG